VEKLRAHASDCKHVDPDMQLASLAALTDCTLAEISNLFVHNPYQPVWTDLYMHDSTVFADAMNNCNGFSLESCGRPCSLLPCNIMRNLDDIIYSILLHGWMRLVKSRV